jgi:hypothetical protein
LIGPSVWRPQIYCHPEPSYIFYTVNNSTIYNYADDNTLFYADYDIKNIVQNLESDSLKMLDWFRNEKRTKRDENGFQRKKSADQKLFAQNLLKLLEEHLLDDRC